VWSSLLQNEDQRKKEVIVYSGKRGQGGGPESVGLFSRSRRQAGISRPLSPQNLREQGWEGSWSLANWSQHLGRGLSGHRGEKRVVFPM
jgi:hypothetical protein